MKKKKNLINFNVYLFNAKKNYIDAVFLAGFPDVIFYL